MREAVAGPSPGPRMAVMSRQKPDPISARDEADREELAERTARVVGEAAETQPQPGLYFYSSPSRTEPVHGVYHPAFCVIAQGAKEVLLGEDRFRYDAENYLLATVGLPATSRVVEATPEKPYLAVRVDLDPALVASVMVEAGVPSQRADASVRAMDVSPLDAGLRDAVLRLVRLLDAPADYRVLAPLVTREIVYRLLKGNQGDRLRQAAVVGGQTHRVARAVERLRKDFDKPLGVEALAKESSMSLSAFHHHFKAVTAMSPLQFQKQLRLQEARRLLLREDVDAASAGFRVGYEDPSHFSREYKRLFGEPPMRDVGRLKVAASSVSRS